MIYRKQDDSGLDRLEREANNEFGLLAEFGPEVFGGTHLLEMSQTMRQRLRQFERLQRLNMLVGATALLWFAGAMIAIQLKHSLLAQISIFLMLLALVGFIAGVIFLKAKFESRGELEHTLDVIEEELRRRSARQGSGARKR
jgi:multisubunit Na+/H+ antiporter MnhF subunit